MFGNDKNKQNRKHWHGFKTHGFSFESITKEKRKK